MKLHFVRLGAISSEWLDIQSFNVVYNPEYDSNWVKVKHLNATEELICPVGNLYGCYTEQ